MADVKLEDIRKTYAGHRAVRGVSIIVGSGQLCSLVGPSGCGKTTCLNMVAGFLTPDSGSIRIGARDIAALPAHKRDTSMVFQGYALFPHLTVRQNVAFGLHRRRVPKADIDRRCEEMLAMVRLTGLGERYPRQLSGGQQQRVALARALVVSPRVLLLDEPLSNLDAQLREQMREEIRRLQQTLGITTLYVTHDQEEALAISDQIVVMNQGQVEQAGTPAEIYDRPRTGFVAGFIGAANLLPVTVGEGAVRLADGQMLAVPPGHSPADGPAQLVLRPEHLIPADAPAPGRALRARLDSALFLGAVVQTRFMLGETELRVRLSPDRVRGLAVGDIVTLAVDIDRAVLVP